MQQKSQILLVFRCNLLIKETRVYYILSSLVSFAPAISPYYFIWSFAKGRRSRLPPTARSNNLDVHVLRIMPQEKIKT